MRIRLNAVVKAQCKNAWYLTHMKLITVVSFSKENQQLLQTTGDGPSENSDTERTDRRKDSQLQEAD